MKFIWDKQHGFEFIEKSVRDSGAQDQIALYIKIGSQSTYLITVIKRINP